MRTRTLNAEALRAYEKLALWTEIWGPGGLELAADLAGAMRLPLGARVLDAGGGSGEVACFLAMHFGWRVTMLEYGCTDLPAAKVRTRGLTERVTVVQGDMRTPPFAAASFDGIVCQGALEMLGDERHLAVQALKQVLKPGGVFGVAEPMLWHDLSAEQRQHIHGSDYARPFWTPAHYAATLEQAGLIVECVELHPEGLRFWDEFHAPLFYDQGQLTRPEREAEVGAWRRDGGEHLGIGIVVGRLPA